MIEKEAVKMGLDFSSSDCKCCLSNTSHNATSTLTVQE